MAAAAAWNFWRATRPVTIAGRAPSASICGPAAGAALPPATRAATGCLLGCRPPGDARGDNDKKFGPATFWRNGGKGVWRNKSWPGARPLFGLDRLAARPDAIVLLAEGEKAAASVEDGPLADI